MDWTAGRVISSTEIEAKKEKKKKKTHAQHAAEFQPRNIYQFLSQSMALYIIETYSVTTMSLI